MGSHKVFAALVAGLRRRRQVPADGVAVPYHADLRPMLILLVAASALEMGVMHLLVPWGTVAIVLLVIEVYGVLWVLGFAASTSVYPHVVGPAELRLRFATLTDLGVPLALVRSVRAQRKGSHTSMVEAADGTLAVSVSNTTTVVVELSEPYPVDLGRRGIHEVSEVRFHADDPQAAVTALHAALAFRSAPG